MDIKKILVPTDFSLRANSALSVAASIAKQTDAEITLLHIIEVPAHAGGTTGGGDFIGTAGGMGTGIGAEDNEEIMRVPYMVNLIKYTKGKIEELKEKYSDVTIHEKVVFDRVHKHIYHFVEDNNVDLVVMGSNGAAGMDEIIVGSNTERVVRHLNIPVLTIKSEITDFTPRNIVFASDFEHKSEETVNFLKLMEHLYGSTVHLVKVITPNNFETSTTTEKRIQDFIDKSGLDNATVNFFNYYTEEEGIISFAESVEADLVTLTTHGRTGISRFLMGSIAENVTNHSKTAVVTFKLKD